MKNNLKDIRSQAGLTQEQLAQAVGTSKSYISQLENGTRNIDTIRQSTMSKLCAALNCNLEDLLVLTKFEYDENGKLLVDAAWHDPRFPTGYILIINDDAFLLPMGMQCKSGEDAVKKMHFLRTYEKKGRVDELRNYEYMIIPCVPKAGFDIRLGRAITEKEWAEIREEYNITDDDISGTFEDVKGAIYGKYAKTYTCIQVKVKTSQAIGLEGKLINMGIEAGNIAPGRVNIRVE